MDVKISLATLIAWSCIILMSVPVPVHGGNTKKRLKALEEQYDSMNKKIDEILQQTLDVSSLQEHVEANTESIERVEASLDKTFNTLTSDLKNELSETMANIDSEVSAINEAITDDMQSLQQKIEECKNNSVSTIDFNNFLQEKKVMFSARVTPSTTLKPDQTLVFAEDVTNEGNAYSNITGVFTAPINGTYLFFVHILSSNRVLEMKMVKNGENAMMVYVHGSIHGEGSNMAILKLEKGDQVKVVKHQSWGSPPFYVHHKWSTFSGFMLHAD
ncbi:hypothetical protein ACF0H5_013256 [Mactra antiquata]